MDANEFLASWASAPILTENENFHLESGCKSVLCYFECLPNKSKVCVRCPVLCESVFYRRNETFGNKMKFYFISCPFREGDTLDSLCTKKKERFWNDLKAFPFNYIFTWLKTTSRYKTIYDLTTCFRILIYRSGMLTGQSSTCTLCL